MLKKTIPTGGKSNSKQENLINRTRRDVATRAVKASIQASRVAATKALREADVIVCTSVGAADPTLLSACGIYPEDEDEEEEENQRLKAISKNGKGEKGSANGKKRPIIPSRESKTQKNKRRNAPDDGPPLTLPFVIVDEACQSVEPANLIPITATDSCRALVLLGDPCQLPPTVKGMLPMEGDSGLSLSLMSRLASVLPNPVVFSTPLNKSDQDNRFLHCKETRQAVSLIKYRSSSNRHRSTKRENNDVISYRKRYAGSLLLSVQYRMHPSIAAFSSSIFYDGLLSTPLFMSQFRPFPSSLQRNLPLLLAEKSEKNNSRTSSLPSQIGVRFVNIGGQKGESRKNKIPGMATAGRNQEENTSYSNQEEAKYIVELIKKILSDQQHGGNEIETIGVVTPYSAQVALLKSQMASDPEFRVLATQQQEVFIEVKSVDAYQGRERDLIIFSAVRSNRQGKIGFLSDWRRMNVAITRAKCGLVVVGDSDTLKEGDVHWEAFVQWCENTGCCVDTAAKELF